MKHELFFNLFLSIHPFVMGHTRSKRTADREERLQLALKSWKKQEYPSIRKTARQFNVNDITLGRQIKGGLSIAESREPQQLLSIAEETALYLYNTRLSRQGYHPEPAVIKEMAEELRRARVEKINVDGIQLVVYEPIGEEWVERFIGRHPLLKRARVQKIERLRVKEIYRDDVIEWFNDLDTLIWECNIKRENIYNMDETGSSIGMLQRKYVIVNKMEQAQGKIEPRRQEWVTVVECICADGSSIPPLIIFKGENLNCRWIPTNSSEDWYYACNSKGWTSNEHAIEWLQKCFEPTTTQEKANSATQLLIYDGHGSHVTGPFLSHCLKHDIQVVLLLPHTSHLLQPLDVGVFSPLKHYLSQNIDKLVCTGIAKVEKCEWVECFVKARPLALTSKNIQSGFKATGIYPPVDRSKVLDKFPLREPINATSQNNTTECPATPEAGDITLAHNLRENPILDTPILNILEKKVAKKTTTDVFDSVTRDLFQSMLYACRVKNHDDKIKD
jgi:DDE superfamily endonuclease/Tc5 transposase DNA-binding domain